MTRRMLETFDYEPRERRKCSDCDRVRLTTRARVRSHLTACIVHEIRLCNDCLVKAGRES